MRDALCVALDGRDVDQIEKIASATAPYAGVFKVGLTSYISGGASLVDRLRRARPVFLDLKFHDIPAQVHNAVRAAAGIGASYTTVHAAGGRAMLEAAADAAPEGMTVLAVTLLTSLETDDLARLGVTGTPNDVVLRVAELALEAGIRGLVCSPREVVAVRREFGGRDSGGPLLVVPGIRSTPGHDDQRRILAPGAALAAGADLLVVGRPITAAADPAAAARGVLAEMAAGASRPPGVVGSPLDVGDLGADAAGARPDGSAAELDQAMLRLLEDRGAVLRGHFLLSSGRHSDLFIQKFRVLEDPVAAARLGRRLAGAFEDGFDVVVAPAVGAIVLGFCVGLAAGKRVVFAERVGGAMTLRRGFELTTRDKALVVEDVVTTGGSAREVVELVRRAGATPVGVAALIDRGDPARPADLGVPLVALVTLRADSFAPEDCPLCAAGEALQDPGSRRIGG